MDAQPAATGRRTPGESRAYVPALLALGAPLAVVTALEVTGNVVAAFVAYHVVFCLLAPLAALGFGGHDLASIRRHLGLGSPSRGGWLVGLVVASATLLAVLVPILALRTSLLAQAPLAATLAGWGVPAGVSVPLIVYMFVVNTGAEELFWRGYLQTEAVDRLGTAAGIGLLALAFASYHVYTLVSLLGDLGLALLGGLGVLAGALLWSWLRERYDSLVPALLGHAGATAGYMAAYVVLI